VTTGLVLAGGGAKGAYQIGAWRALRERGIELDVIAGTSIGALNAALVAAGDLDRAQAFWRSLSTARLARAEPLLLLGLGLRLASTLVPRAGLSQAHPSTALRKLALWGPLAVLALTGLAVGVGLLLLPVPSAAVLGLGSLLAAYGLLLFLPDVSELANGALISRRVLARLIDEGVDWAKVLAGRPAVFVTLARAAFVRRPLRRQSTKLIPDYAKLADLDPSVAHSCLAASMALPFGIFPRIEIESTRYMDGGLADNVPLYPLLLEGCRRIYVVHLSPRPRYRDLDLLDDEQLEAAMHWIDSHRGDTGEPRLYGRRWFEQRFELAAAMREAGIDDATILDSMGQRYDLPGSGQVKIVHIVPRRRLGWGLLGTLVFGRAKTERLMAMGYEDAKATLANLRPPRAPEPGWRERRGRRATRAMVLVLLVKVLVILGLWALIWYLE
jgi:NTE family protein